MKHRFRRASELLGRLESQRGPSDYMWPPLIENYALSEKELDDLCSVFTPAEPKGGRVYTVVMSFVGMADDDFPPDVLATVHELFGCEYPIFKGDIQNWIG